MEAILKHIVCPVCKLYMLSDIFQCVSGHSVCQSCRDMLSRCPICEEVYGNTRNFALESLSKKLSYPCNNEGCKLKAIPYDHLSAHQDKCLFGRLFCPVDKCSRKGKLAILKQHLKDTHSKLMNNGSGDGCDVILSSLAPSKVYVGMKSINEEIFYWKFETTSRLLFGYVKHIGINSSQYTYQITLNNADTKCLLLFEYPVASVQETDFNIMKSGRIFCVGVHILKECALPVSSDSLKMEIKINSELCATDQETLNTE